MIFLTLVANGYILVTLVGAKAQNHDFSFPLMNRIHIRVLPRIDEIAARLRNKRNILSNLVYSVFRYHLFVSFKNIKYSGFTVLLVRQVYPPVRDCPRCCRPTSGGRDTGRPAGRVSARVHQPAHPEGSYTV